jgi:prepilin-type N-terminal cleavage/methylation domain-containing protein
MERAMISSPKQSRSGFTLIEVLVVIAIISILAAMTLAATFQMIDSQRESNTKATILNVRKVLEPQVAQVLASTEKDRIPPGVLTMAGGDMRRARVIWKLLRLKQEFPMTYAEALAPWSTSPANPYVTAADLPAKPVFQRALASVPGGGNEPNALLLLSLELNRGGVAMAADNLGSSAVITNNTSGLRELTDGWRRPLEFFRFPSGHPEMDASNPAPAGSRGTRYRNPVDPDGLLLSPTWNNWNNYSNPAFRPVYWFELLCHPVHTGTTAATYQPMSSYMVPTLVSAGRNDKVGLNNRDAPTYSYNDDMSVSNANDANDNLYSFLLK